MSLFNLARSHGKCNKEASENDTGNGNGSYEPEEATYSLNQHGKKLGHGI
jgi:hypothetical protein